MFTNRSLGVVRMPRGRGAEAGRAMTPPARADQTCSSPGSAVPTEGAQRSFSPLPRRGAWVGEDRPLSRGTHSERPGRGGTCGRRAPGAHRPEPLRRSRSPRGEQRPSRALPLSGPQTGEEPTCGGARSGVRRRTGPVLWKGCGPRGRCGRRLWRAKVVLAGGARSPRAPRSRERGTRPGGCNGTIAFNGPPSPVLIAQLCHRRSDPTTRKF